MTRIQYALLDKGVVLVSIGWSSFILENLVMSHNREDIIRNFGRDTYQIAYSCLSTLSCGAIVYSYFRHCKGRGPILVQSYISRTTAFLLQSLGLIGFSQLGPKLQNPFILSPSVRGTKNEKETINSPIKGEAEKLPKIMGITLQCPIDFKGSHSGSHSEGDIVGLERVTRHPVLWSLAAICLGRAATAHFVTEAVAFSFPTIWAVIGGAHTDYRHRRGWGGYLSPDKDARSSNVPFMALATGRQSWEALGVEVKWTNAALAVTAASLIALRRMK
eukprot:gene8555-17644_t